jgi:cell wall-associated NlpC family hydrolase
MTAKDLIISAHKLIGKPYVWGGESMLEGGYDCSGLLYAILRDCNYSTARTTAANYSLIGKRIPIGQEKPGDFLFFGSPITHCGVYIGNEKMIESRGCSKNTKDNPGTGVVISPVTRRSDLSCICRVWDEKSPSYKIGRTYTIMVDHLHVRSSVWGQIKEYTQLTKDGMKQAYSDGCLKKGTVVTIKDIKKDADGAAWVRIPSGWICAITAKGEVYLK